MSGLKRPGSEIDLRRIVAPVLVLEGVRDDPDLAQALADALHVELQIMPGLDHLQAFSRLDLVMPVVVGFLEHLGL